MVSYTDVFGPVPVLSSHAWRRLRERGVTVTALQDALAGEPRPGTTVGTVIYEAEELTVVVDRATGVIITLWWSR
jgi:hypothetical protein